MQYLVETILACAQRQDRWEPAIDALADEFDLFAAVLFKLHDFQTQRGGFYWSDRVRTGLPEAVRRQVEAGEDTDDHAAFAGLLQLPPLVPHDELSILGVNRVEDLPPSDIRAHANAAGVKVRIGTILNRNGPWADCLITHTKGPEDHIAFAHDPRFRMIAPLLAGTVTIGRVFDELRSRYNAALMALDHLGLGVFILDSAGRVVERNAGAQAILDQRDGIALASTGELRLADPEAQLALKQAVQTQSHPLEAGPDARLNMLTAPRPSGAFDFLISARALRDVDGEMARGFAGVFLTVIDPTRRDVLSADGLTELGALTDAESRITQMLVQGHKVLHISEQQEVSVETVRSHVKSVLRKLRCNSQGDVIRAAASTRLPFVKK